MPSRVYQCITLPCDRESVIQWAPKFIEFRLSSLKIDTTWSVSSYEYECGISQEEWITILSQPAFRVLLCVSTLGEEDVELWQNEWAGVLFLYGPLYHYDTEEDTLEDKWYIGGAFIPPSHRGHGVTLDTFRHCLLEINRAFGLDRGAKRHNAARYRTRIQAVVDVRFPGKIKHFAKLGLIATQVTTAGDYFPIWNLPIGPDQRLQKYALVERVLERQTRTTASL